MPGGPLKVLVELAQEREEQIPALVYEARPAVGGGGRISLSAASDVHVLNVLLGFYDAVIWFLCAAAEAGGLGS